MRLLVILTVLATIVQSYRTSIYFLRRDVSFIKKMMEIIVLIMMIILGYFNLVNNLFHSSVLK